MVFIKERSGLWVIECGVVDSVVYVARDIADDIKDQHEAWHG